MAGISGQVEDLRKRLHDLFMTVRIMDLSLMNMEPRYEDVQSEVLGLQEPLETLNFLHISDLTIQQFIQAIEDVSNTRRIVIDVMEKDLRAIIASSKPGPDSGTTPHQVYDFINSLLRFNEFCHRIIATQRYSQLIDLSTNATLIKELREHVTNFNSKNLEIKSLLDSARTLSGKFIIEKYAKTFSQESNNFMWQAIGWLTLSIILLVAIVALGINNYNLLEPYLIQKVQRKEEVINSGILLQLTINKVLIVSCLFFGLSVAIKNYRWSRHNQTVNKHRQNAISTFEAYLESFKPDEQTRNAMLMEVSRTIFGSQSTGFVDKDNEDSPTQIFEIFKPLANAGK